MARSSRPDSMEHGVWSIEHGARSRRAGSLQPAACSGPPFACEFFAMWVDSPGGTGPTDGANRGGGGGESPPSLGKEQGGRGRGQG